MHPESKKPRTAGRQSPSPDSKPAIEQSSQQNPPMEIASGPFIQNYANLEASNLSGTGCQKGASNAGTILRILQRGEVEPQREDGVDVSSDNSSQQEEENRNKEGAVRRYTRAEKRKGHAEKETSEGKGQLPSGTLAPVDNQEFNGKFDFEDIDEVDYRDENDLF